MNHRNQTEFVHPQRILFLILALMALGLTACGSQSTDADQEKPVIEIRIRSNRVDAQTNSVNFYSAYAVQPSPTPRPLPTSTPTPVLGEASPAATAQALALIPRVTPTPLSLMMGRPDRIVLPGVGIDTSVVSVYASQSQVGNRWFQDWSTADFSAGFHETSAILGRPGNTVISGHNNIGGSVFRDLYMVQPGDTIQVYSDGYRFDYIVEEQFIVREAGVSMEQRMQNASWIQPTIDERVTLVSCWPPEGNSHRVIVVAKPIHDSAQALRVRND